MKLRIFFIVCILSVLTNTLFLSTDVFAQTCCLVEKTSVELEPVFNAGTGKYTYSRQDSSATTEKTCRAEMTTPCKTSPAVEVVSGSGLLGSSPNSVRYEYTTKETQIACDSDTQLCAGALKSLLASCPDYNNSQTTCNSHNECFYHAGQCKSVFDVQICQSLPNDLCTKSRVCEWFGNQCLPILEANLAREHQVSEGYSSFLPACAYTGTCTNLEDLILVVINITREIFKYIGVLAFVFFLIGGATMIASFGNPERFSKGRQILVAAAVGLIISLSAFVLVAFILNAVGVSNTFRIF